MSEDDLAEDYDAYLELYNHWCVNDEELHGEPIHPFDRGRF